MQKLHWYCHETPRDVAAAVAQHVLSLAEEAISLRGAFKIVLAGGSTPEQCYRLIAQSKVDWTNWHIYFGDERCVPADASERNSVMAQQAWLNQVAIPSEQIHAIPAELGPECGAEIYAPIVQDALPFDAVLLGMGEDGHTASLFPGHDHDDTLLTVAVHHSPKPPPERVSLSYRALASARKVMILVTGIAKHPAVTAWRAGDPLPVALIMPHTPVEVHIDKAALNP